MSVVVFHRLEQTPTRSSLRIVLDHPADFESVAWLPGAAALNDLGARDIYELPEPTYRRLVLQPWQAFGKQASAEPDTWVLKCCLLQNPITTLLVKHNCDEPVICKHIAAVLEAVSALDPIVVHLHQGDIRVAVIPQPDE